MISIYDYLNLFILIFCTYNISNIVQKMSKSERWAFQTVFSEKLINKCSLPYCMVNYFNKYFVIETQYYIKKYEINRYEFMMQQIVIYIINNMVMNKLQIMKI